MAENTSRCANMKYLMLLFGHSWRSISGVIEMNYGEQKCVAAIGTGMAGLAAAWQLKQMGMLTTSYFKKRGSYYEQFNVRFS